MHLFIKFILVFFYLEISMFFFACLLECYRFFAYRHAAKTRRANIYKRRVLKEISSISKSNFFFFYDFFGILYCFLLVGDFF